MRYINRRPPARQPILIEVHHAKRTTAKLNGWARQNLTQYILPFWTSDFIIDYEYGGFYGRVSADMEIDNTEPRGLTLAGRMTYAFSVAYRVLDDEVCKERATYAYRDLISRFTIVSTAAHTPLLAHKAMSFLTISPPIARLFY